MPTDNFDGVFGGALAGRGFAHIKWLIEQGRDARIFVWADSLCNEDGSSGDGTKELTFRMADMIAGGYPNANVRVYTYNTVSNLYDLLYTAQTGSGPTVTIQNYSIAGAPFQYAMGMAGPSSAGGRWFGSSAIAFEQADLLVTCHGHNHVAGTPLAAVLGEFMAALETWRLYHPGCPIIAVIENPQQILTEMSTAFQAWQRYASLRDIDIIDAYTPYINAGKPAGWYRDVIHPNNTGYDNAFAPPMQALFYGAVARPYAALPSLLVPVPSTANLLENGDFSKWTTSPGVPDRWTAGGAGTLTAQKETTILDDSRQPWSAKLTATGNQAYIYQDAAAGMLDYMRGRPVTLAVRRYKVNGESASVGRIALSAGSVALGTQTINSRGYNTELGGWMWWIIAGFSVPADASYIRATLYHDSATTPSAGAAYYSQAILTPGYLPAAIR